MVKYFSKVIISVIFISSILCSFGKAFNHPDLARNLPTNFSVTKSHPATHAVIATQDHSNPFSLPFSLFTGEESELEEEYTKKKKNSFQGYYTNGEQITHLVNAPPFHNIINYSSHLNFPPLYLLFEVFS